jgi:anti-sigma B factor antagonist
MEITKEKTGNVVLFEVKGRLDTSTSKTLEETLFASIDEGEKQFALGCSQLDYISSAGLRVLLLALKRLRSIDGKIVLYALKAQLKEVFDIAGFSSIFPLFNVREEALRSFEQ